MVLLVTQFTIFLGETTFINRKNKFTNANVVLYHPGHFLELNQHISKLYNDESFRKIDFKCF